MTLTTLLKRHGVKARGLESAINRWEWELNEPFHKIRWELDEKVQQLEKLNTDLHARCADYRVEMQKKDDQIKAAEVKLKFTETQKSDFQNKWSDAEQKVDEEKGMVKFLRERIAELEGTIVHAKVFGW